MPRLTIIMYRSKITLFIVLGVALLFPYVSTIFLSLHSFAGTEMKFAYLDNYRIFFSETFRLKTLWVVVARSLFNSFLSVALAIPFGYIVNRFFTKKWQTVTLCIITLPFLINTSIRVFSWNEVLGGRGLVHSVWLFLAPNAIPFSWLSNSEFAVNLTMSAASIPLATFILTMSLSTIPEKIWLAAQDLGASNSRLFFKLAIPYLKMHIIFTWLLIFVLGISIYSEVDFLGGASKHSLKIMINDLLSASKIESVMTLGSSFIVIIFFAVASMSFAYKMHAMKKP